MKVSFLWEKQFIHWPCWLVVGLGSGIAWYFALPFEPPLWMGGLALAACLCLWRFFKGTLVRAFVLFLIFASLGFVAATLRTWHIAAPQLERAIHAAKIEGRIVDIEYLSKGFRLTLDELIIKDLPAKDAPRKVRVKLWRLSKEFKPGDRISLTASLAPIARASMAGAFDFRRDAFFRGLGATGFSYKAPDMIEASPSSSLRHFFARLSHKITSRILEIAKESPGALMVALMTGDQSILTQKDIAAMRDSGLAHLLSISGLHIGMAFGLLFIVLRGALALFPALALNYPIKKWAVFPAFMGAAFYALLAGLPVPTERSLIMVGVASIAILLDRQIFSLRLVACAAFLVLLVSPEALIGPSFQLSFSAVTALIAAYELVQKSRFMQFEGMKSLPRRIIRWFLGIIIASSVATLATAPFAIYHFNRLAIYGIIANIIGIPLTGFIVMPAGVASLLLMPLGWDAPALHVMELGSILILNLAKWVQSWPLSVLTIASMPVTGLILASIGLLCLFLLVGRMRLIGIVFYACGLISIGLVSRPDFIVSEDGRLFAVRGVDGNLYLSSTRRSKLTAETWLRRNGQTNAPGIEENPDLKCDALGCQFHKGGKLVALGYDEDSLKDDCLKADLVINLEPIHMDCGKQTIDRFTLWREGGQAVYLKDGEILVIPVARENTRPWQARRYRPSLPTKKKPI